MKFALCLLIVLGFMNEKVYSQSLDLDSLRVERIAKTCQLWGHIKYFHPYLSDDSINWESSFTNHIGDVYQAESSKEYADAIQNMLDNLNDPATRVISNNNTPGSLDTLRHPVIEFKQDSILFVSVNDYADLEDYNYTRDQFLSLPSKMQLSKGVVFDLRSPDNIGAMKGYLSWYFSTIEGSFSNEKIHLPGFVSRFHDGFAPETGMSSGGYASGVYTKGEKTIVPDIDSETKPMVFVVNENSEIPAIVLGLQLAGKAKVLSHHPLTDASLVETVNLEMDDSISVSIRQNVLPPYASLKTDFLIPANFDETQLVELATKLLKGQKIDNIAKPVVVKESHKESIRKQENKNVSSYPDKNHRLLAAAKIWTVIHYFFAYKDLMTDDWDETLTNSIPQFVKASDSLEYHLAVAEMYKKIQDGHGYIRSKTLSKFFGTIHPPIKIRFIEDQATIVGLLPDSIADLKSLEVGDVLLEIDGEKVTDKFNKYAKYLSASNPSWLKHTVARRLLTGKDSTNIELKVKKRNNKIENVSLLRSASFNRHIRQMGNERNSQAMTRLINENIGYADLDRLTSDKVEQMFIDFKDTKAIIFDMRGYPNGTAWSISPYLTDKRNVLAANFRRYSPMGIDMGAMNHMTFIYQNIPIPRQPTYTGKTVMLIDERTMSQAEHTGLFFEAANETKFIGSQTAGANGDVTDFQIPGNMILNFSGHDVRHSDGSQLQKIGLIPSLEVKPTIEGIRTAADEVLEKAIEFVKQSIAEE